MWWFQSWYTQLPACRFYILNYLQKLLDFANQIGILSQVIQYNFLYVSVLISSTIKIRAIITFPDRTMFQLIWANSITESISISQIHLIWKEAIHFYILSFDGAVSNINRWKCLSDFFIVFHTENVKYAIVFINANRKL